MNPITGIPGCCVRAASGHAAAVPPSNVINSRRFIFRLKTDTSCKLGDKVPQRPMAQGEDDIETSP
jgi:hypothetical protein